MSENVLEWFFGFIFQPCGIKLSQLSLNYTTNNAMSKLLLDYREGSGSYYKKWIYFDISLTNKVALITFYHLKCIFIESNCRESGCNTLCKASVADPWRSYLEIFMKNYTFAGTKHC